MPRKELAVINVGILGLGVVGTGVVAALIDNETSLSHITGRRVNLKSVLVRDKLRTREIELPAGLLTTNAQDILDDPDIHVLVEVMGGTDPAENYLGMLYQLVNTSLPPIKRLWLNQGLN